MWILGWTPDSRRIVYSEQKGIWSVPAEGGEPRRLQLKVDRLRDLSVHPDGRQILYNDSRQEMEVWTMENLIPAVERALGSAK